MDQLGLAGAADGLRSMTVARRVAGPVITVQLGPADGRDDACDSGPGDSASGIGSNAATGRPEFQGAQSGGSPPPHASRHLGTAAIEAAQPGDVIVVAAGGRIDAAGWGGILSLAAVTRHVRGVIVDGACRDVDESAELGLPVFALAATPRTARGRQTEVAWDVPVLIGGISVEPGDLVVADGSGVVFLPAGRAAEIIAATERIAAREAAMAARVRDGEPVSQVMSADYEDLLTVKPDPP
jgi:4-hydroxy-4-methyl-2-oxoglutarate aldolase